jgi:hypothetical protein
VSLVQLIRFLVVELIHTCSNIRFDMSVVFTANYSFSGGDVSVDSETLLVTNFMNLKIKPTQSFRDVPRDRIYVHIFIEINTHTSINIYIYTIFFKGIDVRCRPARPGPPHQCTHTAASSGAAGGQRRPKPQT